MCPYTLNKHNAATSCSCIPLSLHAGGHDWRLSAVCGAATQQIHRDRTGSHMGFGFCDVSPQGGPEATGFYPTPDLPWVTETSLRLARVWRGFQRLKRQSHPEFTTKKTSLFCDFRAECQINPGIFLQFKVNESLPETLVTLQLASMKMYQCIIFTYQSILVIIYYFLFSISWTKG